MDEEDFLQAAKYGDVEKVRRGLEAGVYVNTEDEYGDTGLHRACAGGHVKVVELLIKNGANVNVTNWTGDTGLHQACGWGRDKVVELFIKNGADVNLTNAHGYTGLHKACDEGHDKIVELLIKNGANLNVTNNDGWTGLHYACRGGHDKVVELLIKNGADLNVTNRNGDTGLHYACYNGHDKVVEMLIKNGADVNVTDEVGNIGLYYACAGGHDKVVELLIKNGAYLNVTDKGGWTGLHKACWGGHDKVVELFIKNGADLNVTNKDGWTGLHAACEWGHDKVVELLIENRADLNVTNRNNKRPVDVAARLGRDTQLLLKTETRKQAEYSELVSSVGSEEGTTVKLFLCGDGQVGKTSLRVILKKTGFFVGALWNIKRQFRRQDAFNPTPGVHVSSKTVRGIGRLSLHDFAGQAQFYVTHAMLLRTTNAIFPVVYKITDGEHEQKRQIHGWLSFIHCSNTDPTNKPRIILIASHADKLQDQEAGLRRATALVEHYRKLFQESLIVSQEVFLINCLEAGSAEIQRLREVLAAFKDDILKQRPKVPKVCARLLDKIEGWKQERKAFPVMAWQEYLASMEKATYGTVKGRIVQLASSYLHDEGEIISLCHEANSSVVLDPQWSPVAAWSPVSSKAVYFGLQIRGRTEIDSFSCDLFPRLQTLLMQAHPDKLSRPLLWKNSAKCTDGKAEALLHITQDKRQLNIFVRSTKGFREDCNSIMDLLKNMTYRLLHETSPGSRSRDMVLSALDLREHRPQPHAYSREEVEAAAEEGRDVVHPKRNIPEDVKDLILQLSSLKGMLGRVARKRPELVETLRHINPILDHLRADDVINLDENDRIRAARTPQDAARELLDILEAKGERACVKFHSVLKTCDKFAASLILEEEMSEEGATAN